MLPNWESAISERLKIFTISLLSRSCARSAPLLPAGGLLLLLFAEEEKDRAHGDEGTPGELFIPLPKDLDELELNVHHREDEGSDTENDQE